MTPKDFSKLSKEQMIEVYTQTYKVIAGKDHVMKSFGAIYHFITSISMQIANAKIDLSADKDEKTFDRSIKFISELQKATATLEYLQLSLTPDEIKEAKKETETETSYVEAITKAKEIGNK